MPSKPSSPASTAAPRSDRGRSAGSSLVELLVTVGVSAVVMLGVATFFSQQAHAMRGHGFRLEMQQALRGALDAMTRDLRLAGACLPSVGTPVGISGTDGVDGDSITINAGMVQSNMTCVKVSTTADAAAGATAVSVPSTTGFVVGKMALIWDNSNSTGEFVVVSSANGTVVGFSPGLGRDYASGSAVYPVDRRKYYLDKTVDPPLLMLQVDEQAPQPFAAGIRDLQFQYVIADGTNAGVTVDLPADAAAWRMLNEITVSATAETVGGVLPSDNATLTQTARAKPRNMVVQ